MRKRFIGPEPHEVTVAGRDFGTVEPGDVLEVPDELVKPTKDWPGVVFPESLWEDAPADKKQSKKDGEG